MNLPTTARATADGAADPLPFDQARAALGEATYYWLATTHPSGRPHVRPVLAVLVDDRLVTTTSPTARKGRNLGVNPACTLAAATEELHLVVEGRAEPVRATVELHRIADAYRRKYGWAPSVDDGVFDGPDGAPTAGAPPYEAVEIVPDVVYAFGSDDRFGPRATRWQFEPGGRTP